MSMACEMLSLIFPQNLEKWWRIESDLGQMKNEGQWKSRIVKSPQNLGQMENEGQ